MKILWSYDHTPKRMFQSVLFPIVLDSVGRGEMGMSGAPVTLYSSPESLSLISFGEEFSAYEDIVELRSHTKADVSVSLISHSLSWLWWINETNETITYSLDNGGTLT
jgi:hypothetical protein